MARTSYKKLDNGSEELKNKIKELEDKIKELETWINIWAIDAKSKERLINEEIERLNAKVTASQVYSYLRANNIPFSNAVISEVIKIISK